MVGLRLVRGGLLLVGSGFTESHDPEPNPPLLAVDLATGNRLELADPTPSDGIEISRADEIVVDGIRNRALVLARGSILSVDLETAERIVLLDGSRTDLGPSLHRGYALAFDASRNVALVTGNFTVDLPVVVSIDLETGERANPLDRSLTRPSVRPRLRSRFSG